MKYNILPYPQKIEDREGTLDLSGITVATESGMEYRVVRAAVELRRELSGITGAFHTYKQYFGDARDGMIAISINETLSAEAYTLEITLGGIVIKGGDGAGCYYGIVTLKQLISQFGVTLPCLYISDKPGMSYRGFYHDATRGRVPTIDNMKELADTIAYFKGNSLQLYVEHVFDLRPGEGERISSSPQRSYLSWMPTATTDLSTSCPPLLPSVIYMNCWSPRNLGTFASLMAMRWEVCAGNSVWLIIPSTPQIPRA